MIDSPCNGCKHRKMGCHNVSTCDAWRDYVAANKKMREQRANERGLTGYDCELHSRRKGYKVPQK